MGESADIVIIGGGAAGLAAGIFAAQAAGETSKIIVLDGARTVGAKILVSGGGRCNVTHDVVSPADFNGSRNVVRNVLAAFDATAAVNWFASLGVELKREENGKLFPVANTAKAVLAALLNRCGELNVGIRGSCRVTAVTAPSETSPRFIIRYTGGTLATNRVIFCTGGKSLPRSGSDGAGWDILGTLGHTVSPTFAALVPLVLEASMFHASVAGISLEIALSTFVDGKLIDRRTGSLLWTHFGISGPVVMDASRHWVTAHESGRSAKMECSLLPLETFETVERWLIGLATTRARLSIQNAIGMRLPDRMAGAVVGYAKIDPATTCGQLTRDARRALVHAITALPLPIVQRRGWNYAEVTAGGVPLNEIDYRTMQSRKVPGLYLAGEILDCDGRIGGFNFQWAWATGYLAGKAAAANVTRNS